MDTIQSKYAKLLVNYCLNVQSDEKIYVSASYLAEPLLQEVIKEIYLSGAHPFLNVEINNGDKLLMKYGKEHQLAYINPLKKYVFENFDAYLNIRAPFTTGDGEESPADLGKYKIHQQANAALTKIYFERTGSGSMRRCLCQYPTQAGADDARMPFEDYEKFVYHACGLYEENPVEHWLGFRKKQQVYVDYLNQVDRVQYKGPNLDVSFSVKGRKWMNSDGRANMPSGEVFSAPIENSVNGTVLFSYPCIYMGKDVENVQLEIKDGLIIKWTASKGQEVLDKVFAIDGARHWGEVAVGTNYHIQKITRNILFDEKIGGSIHMAVGQSYKQCGGQNESAVHWDMITDMKDGGEIIADGEVIYRNGEFLI